MSFYHSMFPSFLCQYFGGFKNISLGETANLPLPFRHHQVLKGIENTLGRYIKNRFRKD